MRGRAGGYRDSSDILKGLPQWEHRRHFKPLRSRRRYQCNLSLKLRNRFTPMRSLQKIGPARTVQSVSYNQWIMSAENYRPGEIEPKWREYWASNRLHEARDNHPRPKYYCLDM